jgi:hypothetical protein
MLLFDFVYITEILSIPDSKKQYNLRLSNVCTLLSIIHTFIGSIDKGKQFLSFKSEIVSSKYRPFLKLVLTYFCE